MTHILITGASSGIGAALAAHYAKPGVRLSLSGRDAVRTKATADQCRAVGAVAEATSIDVQDKERMAAWVQVKQLLYMHFAKCWK